MKAKKVQKQQRTKPKTKQVASKRYPQKVAPTIKLAACKRRAIITSLKHVKAMPACVRKLLTKLGQNALSTKGHERAVSMLESMMNQQDAGFQQAVSQLTLQVDCAESEKNSRSEQCSSAEAKIMELKNEIAENKSALKDASRNIQLAQDTISKEAAHSKREGAELSAVSQKKELLQITKDKTFTPLKNITAKGAKGQQKVKELRKVGKQFGFHDVLLGSMPAILRKHPDRRRTFDTLAMRSFSAEFSKKLQKLEESIGDKEAAVADRRAAEESARNDIETGKETQIACTKRLREAEQSLVQAQRQHAAMKSRMRKFPKELREQIRQLGKAKMQLSAFRAGPFAAFKELQQSMQAESSHMEESRTTGRDAPSEEVEEDGCNTARERTDVENDFMPPCIGSSTNVM